MRSEAHTSQLFKIGLSRRDAETRATELNAARVCLFRCPYFSIGKLPTAQRLKKWCTSVLPGIGQTKAREFFRAPISTIIKTIEDVIALGGQA